MSATFTAPTTATGGLQNYDLEPAIRNLAPETAIRFTRPRLRFAAARRGKRHQRGLTKKDTPMDAIHQMVGTLAKSVTDIVAAGGDQRDALLTKSFDEFTAALGTSVADLAKSAADGAVAERAEPLFKGLGTVGRVAQLASRISADMDLIKEGKDWKHQDDKEAKDPASDEVCELLDHALTFIELALRHSVNEHVDIAGEHDAVDDHGMTHDGHHVLVVKSADGSDEMAVKTRLPAELAKFATHPSVLDDTRADLACAELLAQGVSENALAKVFDDAGGEPLNKAVQDPNAVPAGSSAGGADDAGPDMSNQDPMEALNLVGRLLAAAMIQLDGVMRMVEGPDADTGAEDGQGDGDDTGDGTGDGTDGGAPVQPGESNDETVKKNAGTLAGLNKRAGAPNAADPRIDQLTKAVGALTETVGKIAAATPQPAKGMLNDLARLTKAADGADAGGSAGGEEGMKKLAQEIDGLPPDQKVMALTKLAQQVTGRPAVSITR